MNTDEIYKKVKEDYEKAKKDLLRLIKASYAAAGYDWRVVVIVNMVDEGYSEQEIEQEIKRLEI